MTRLVHAPVPFPGTPEEALENHFTHRFNEDGRCDDCDCRAGGTVSDYPCGEEPPRQTIEVPDWTPASSYVPVSHGHGQDDVPF